MVVLGCIRSTPGFAALPKFHPLSVKKTQALLRGFRVQDLGYRPWYSPLTSSRVIPAILSPIRNSTTPVQISFSSKLCPKSLYNKLNPLNLMDPQPETPPETLNPKPNPIDPKRETASPATSRNNRPRPSTLRTLRLSFGVWAAYLQWV